MNINPRQMQQAMRRMGIQQVEINASEVIIRTPDKEYYFEHPSVAKINMGGQESYQIVGNPSVRSRDSTPDVNEDDIQTVVEQAGVSSEDAKKAILDAHGDLAEAILKLKEN